MPFLLVHHKVADYDRWKEGFDRDDYNRKASECKGGYIFRSKDDPSELFVLLEWDDEHKLREFANSQGLQDRMKAAGITDQADIYVLEIADRPSV